MCAPACWNARVALTSRSIVLQVKFHGVANASSEEQRRELARAYLQGLLWTLHYYFQQGVASWRWCYLYHAAPLPSDLVRLDNARCDAWLSGRETVDTRH